MATPLKLQVMDYDFLKKDDPLGEAAVDLKPLQHTMELEVVGLLSTQGELHLQLRWEAAPEPLPFPDKSDSSRKSASSSTPSRASAATRANAKTPTGPSASLLPPDRSSSSSRLSAAKDVAAEDSSTGAVRRLDPSRLCLSNARELKTEDDANRGSRGNILEHTPLGWLKGKSVNV